MGSGISPSRRLLKVRKFFSTKIFLAECISEKLSDARENHSSGKSSTPSPAAFLHLLNRSILHPPTPHPPQEVLWCNEVQHLNREVLLLLSMSIFLPSVHPRAPSERLRCYPDILPFCSPGDTEHTWKCPSVLSHLPTKPKPEYAKERGK